MEDQHSCLLRQFQASPLKLGEVCYMLASQKLEHGFRMVQADIFSLLSWG